MTDDIPAPPQSPDQSPDEYAIVELMGHVRNRLTIRQIRLLMDRQGAMCGAPGCTTGLIVGPQGQHVNWIDEHLTALALQGTNALKNRALWCKPCAATKTNGTKATTAGSDKHKIGKVDRIRAGGRKRKGPPMKSRPFQKGKRPFQKRAKS